MQRTVQTTMKYSPEHKPAKEDAVPPTLGLRTKIKFNARTRPRKQTNVETTILCPCSGSILAQSLYIIPLGTLLCKDVVPFVGMYRVRWRHED